MRLYLDEDVASRDLTRVLVRAGHDVATPLDAELTGESDAAQHAHALRENRVSLTANYGDFEELHDLVIQSGGSHPGILTIRNDNDRRRDIKPGHIAGAIQNLETVLSSVRGQYICLNDWR